MKYGELIQFDPIEDVVKLVDSDRAEEAKRLVKSYVISDQMAEKISEIVFPLLQFDKPADNKGLLIVGNYGTGKSHLMAVLAAIAEDADLLPLLTSTTVADAATPIAGRFKVVRTEIGSTSAALREIVCQTLEDALTEFEVEYEFPAWKDVVNHLSAFQDMMTAFHKQYPDLGLLLVVDELLDYLRSRKQQEIILDLNFLREIGECCRHLRFRFMAGVQEAVFDSSRFEHVADSVRRVKDRFEQVLIVRDDVKYVVAKRLLSKTADQEARIRDYLTPYCKYYGGMAEHLDEIVSLFPVHPDYIDIFASVTVVEKRTVLKTLSRTMSAMMDQELPDDRPGVVAYDSYWPRLIEDPANRQVEAIRLVMDCSRVLEDRITHAMPREAYKPIALRIIKALSVHRLTTNDINATLGPTSEELRDSLCLFDSGVAEMPGDAAKNLLRFINLVVGEIRKTVSGQFITSNPENGQHYLDLKKTDDYDAKIESMADSLNKDKLDTYYFEIVTRVMGVSETPQYKPGFNIWQTEIEWYERKAGRQGYLFFGSKGERSTTIPQRDFYLYFIQPYNPPKDKEPDKPDEVFFILSDVGEDFHRPLSLYAGAREMAMNATGNAKEEYIKKGNGYLRQISNWLNENGQNAFTVRHRGDTKPIMQWAKNVNFRERVHLRPDQVISFKEVIDGIAGVCLSPRFEDITPQYPQFSVRVTGRNRAQAATDAIRCIPLQKRTEQGAAILDALKLLDGDHLDPAASPYARFVIDALHDKDPGQVLNYGEVMFREHGNEYDALYMLPKEARLEEELALVILASLVYSGHLVLAVPGNKIDSTRYDELTSMSLDTLKNWRHAERPKDWDEPAIRALFELFELPPGLAKQVMQKKASPLVDLHEARSKAVDRIVRCVQSVQNELYVWHQPLLIPEEATQLVKQLNDLKAFLESLQAYNTPAKLQNLRVSEDQVRAQKESMQVLAETEQLVAFSTNSAALSSYLSQAQSILGEQHEWTNHSQDERQKIVALLADKKKCREATVQRDILRRMEALKDAYTKAYANLHTKLRLTATGEKTKAGIMKDPRVEGLGRLSSIKLLPYPQYRDFTDRLANLVPCYKLTPTNLKESPICPHCQCRPEPNQKIEPADQLATALGEALDQMWTDWRDRLIQDLQDPSAQEALELLGEKRELVDAFLDQEEFPDPITPEFVQVVQQALQGLQRVLVSQQALREQVGKNGTPMTVDEFRQRLESFVAEQLKGKEPDKVRIVFE